MNSLKDLGWNLWFHLSSPRMNFSDRKHYIRHTFQLHKARFRFNHNRITCEEYDLEMGRILDRDQEYWADFDLQTEEDMKFLEETMPILEQGIILKESWWNNQTYSNYLALKNFHEEYFGKIPRWLKCPKD